MNDVVADEVPVSTLCATFEMLAHARADQSLHFGCCPGPFEAR